MTPDTIPQTVLFPDLFAKPLVATFERYNRKLWIGSVKKAAYPFA